MENLHKVIMKSNEFIVETPSEDRELIALARKIGDYVKAIHQPLGKLDHFANALIGPMFNDLDKFNMFGIPLSKIVKPKFKEADINTVIKNVDVCSAAIRDDMPDSLGAFGHGGVIYLNIRLMDDIDEVYTVLVHELRHALDFYKRSEEAKDRMPGTGNLEYSKYIVNQDELNARFTQAIMGINSEMPIAEGQLAPTIMKHFTAHHLINVFPRKKNDPRYKQLVKRAVKFYEAQHTIATPKPGFIQQAIKFITAGLL